MRHEIEIVTTPDPPEVEALTMRAGQIGRVTRTRCSLQLGDFILRTFAGWVNLNEPNQTWDGGRGLSFAAVQILPPGTIIKLAVQP